MPGEPSVSPASVLAVRGRRRALLGRASSSVRRQDPGLLLVVAAAAVLGLAYALWAWQRHRWYLTAGFDLGIFDQAAWRMAHFHVPATTLRVEDNLWGDHFHPIIVLWGALRAIWPSANALLISQALLVAGAMVPLYLFARDRAGRTAGVLIALAYGTSWGVQRAIDFDVHEIAFAPVLLAGAVLAADRKRWGWFWVCAVLLLCVKEDVTLVVAALGVWLVATGERRHGAIAIVAGVSWFLLATRWWIPALGTEGFQYWSYSRFGDSAIPALWHLITHPWKVVTVAIDPRVKLDTLVALLAPFLFITPWLTRLAFIPLPLLAERFLSDQPNYWDTHYHYSLLPTMALAIAAAGGVASLRRWTTALAARRATVAPTAPAPASGGARLLCGHAPGAWVAAAVAALGLLLGTLWWTKAFEPERAPLAAMARLDPPPRLVDRELYDRVVAAIPRSGSVAAPRLMQPHLTGRGQDVLLLQSPRPGHPVNAGLADNVVINLAAAGGPDPTGTGSLDNYGMVMRQVERRLADGDLVAARLLPSGWAILRSPRAPGGARPDPGLGTLQGPDAAEVRRAVRRWTRTTERLVARCGSGRCDQTVVDTWRSASRTQAAALSAAASHSAGSCRDLLQDAAPLAEVVVDRLALTFSRPGAAATAAFTQGIQSQFLGAARRAVMVCAPSSDPPPAAPTFGIS